MIEKLRIGLLLNNDMIPAWCYKMLEEIKGSYYGEVVLIVEKKSKGIKKNNIIKRFWRNRNNFIYRAYLLFDRKRYKNNPDASKLININTLLSVDTITVTPKITKYSDTIVGDDIAMIEKYDIDIFIRVGFRILRGEILKIAKYGVWSYHHGDNSVNRGKPAGFWEVMDNCDDTGVILQILDEDLDKGKILFKSFSGTIKESATSNRNNYYWKALSFIPAKMKELYDIGEDKFFENVDEQNRHPEFYYNPLYSPRMATNWTMTKYLSRIAYRKIKAKIHGVIYFRQWILLFNLNNTSSISTSFFRFKKIVPPKDRFWADPHIVQKGGKYYVFVEEYVYKDKKGHISVMEIDNDGNYSVPVKVLDAKYHLSYPFVIEDNGAMYMIPESSENHSIDLYRCVEFPMKWEHEKTIMDCIKAVDSTVIFKDERYWLFANVLRNDGASILDELFVYSSKSLISDTWEGHPKNPIISDVKQSRPAGRLFTHKNNLYRPSQNNAKHYGHGMRISHVTELDRYNYEEHTVGSILPNWDKELVSTHTINSVGKLTVIDAQMLRRKHF
jgi:hypothetical protein